MTPTDLAALRARMVSRRQRDRQVAERFAAADERLKDGDRVEELHLRCDAGSAGHHRLLARVFILEEGLLFVSRIVWRPQDRDVPPWVIEAFVRDELAAIDLEDDVAVARFAETLDAMRHRDPGHNRRWLAGSAPVVIRDVLDLPATPDGWLPELWARCEDHPSHAERLDRQALITAARTTSSARRRPRGTMTPELQTGPGGVRRTT